MSFTYVVGVDPDVERHGVALYCEGKLTELFKLNSLEIMEKAPELGDVVVSIENVMANQFLYKRNQKGSEAQRQKIALNVGRCMQAQVELMRMLDSVKVPYVLHKPQSGNWAENKVQFEKVTGWNKSSNKDTRAAAFFGWLQVNS